MCWSTSRRAGISKEQVARGGYLIRTTLDPKVQASVKSAIDGIASPTLDGVASVMNVIKPGKDAHRVMAMASNRTYGLNGEANETVQQQPFSLVGDGAGSIFKIFTTAAALDMGMGINAQLQVPGFFQAKGLGSSDTPGCPKRNLVCEECRELPRVDECHRRAGNLTEHRFRQVDPTGRRSARGRHGGASGSSVLRASRDGACLRPDE